MFYCPLLFHGQTVSNMVKIVSAEQEKEELDFVRSMGGNLKEGTIRIYLTYYNKLREYMKEYPLDQTLINAFVSIHTNSTARAFLKNYIAYKDLPFKIPKRTGTIASKEFENIPAERLFKIIKHLYENSPNKGFGMAAELASFCALRLSEFVNIKKQDFNTAKLEENIDKGIKAPCELIVHGKGSKDRVTLVPLSLFEKIWNFAETKQEHQKIFSFGEHRFWRKFNEACRALGYIKVVDGKEKSLYHPHSMRRTTATYWLEEGADIIEIKELLGHRSISTTQRYINPDKKRALTKLSKLLPHD